MFLKQDADTLFSSSIKGESQAHLTLMSTGKQFRCSYPYSSPETMTYENVLTWKKELIKTEKFVNVVIEEFSRATAFLQSFFRCSLPVILPLWQLSMTERNVPGSSEASLFSLPVQVINQRTTWMLLPMSIKLGQKCNSSGGKKGDQTVKQKPKTLEHLMAWENNSQHNF